MEKSFKIIEKCLNSVMGIDIFGNRPTKISGYLKTLLCTLLLILSILLEIYFLAFDLNENLEQKIILCCGFPSCLVVSILFFLFLYNKTEYCKLIHWVKERYFVRSSKLVDNLSQAYFKECSEKIGKFIL